MSQVPNTLDTIAYWLALAGYSLSYLILIGAIIAVALRRKIQPAPSRYLLWALTLLLVSRLSPDLFASIYVKYYSASDYTTLWLLMNSIFTHGISTLSLLLFIMAAYVGRPKVDTRLAVDDQSGGRPLADQPNNNPYASPRQ